MCNARKAVLYGIQTAWFIRPLGSIAYVGTEASKSWVATNIF